jgi:segregation and condensation protein B
MSLTPDEAAQNRGIVEALLVASDEPLSASRIASVLNDAGAKEVRDFVDDLNTEYVDTGRSFRVTEVAGGFQLMVHAEFGPWVRRLFRDRSTARLSQASLETLAIVAFKQPIIRAEVEHIRGVNIDGVMRSLMEKGLIRIAGRSEAPGRPLLYGTTRDFLKHFGLKTLSDLPKLRELEDLVTEPPEETEGESLGDLFAAAQSQEGLASDGPDTQSDTELEEEVAGADEQAGASEPVSGEDGSGLPEGKRPIDPDGPGPG